MKTRQAQLARMTTDELVRVSRFLHFENPWVLELCDRLGGARDSAPTPVPDDAGEALSLFRERMRAVDEIMSRSTHARAAQPVLSIVPRGRA